MLVALDFCARHADERGHPAQQLSACFVLPIRTRWSIFSSLRDAGADPAPGAAWLRLCVHHILR
jgi:hypothetical protein